MWELNEQREGITYRELMAIDFALCRFYSLGVSAFFILGPNSRFEQKQVESVWRKTQSGKKRSHHYKCNSPACADLKCLTQNLIKCTRSPPATDVASMIFVAPSCSSGVNARKYVWKITVESHQSRAAEEHDKNNWAVQYTSFVRCSS